MPTDNALRLNVGCGRNIIPGWLNVDIAPLPGVDVVADLEACRQTPLPFEDSTVEAFLLSHVIEHIRDPLSLMQELYRIAKPNASMMVRVPYGSSDDAFEDPTHVRQYFHGSFGYFSQPFYWRADYGYRGDWITSRIVLKVDRLRHHGLTPAEIFEKVNRERNVVQEMEAVLVANKPARPPEKELQLRPNIEIGLV